MEAKEKARELIEKFKQGTFIDELPKEHALIAVEEIIQVMPSVNGRPPNYQDIDKYCREYWKLVKQEINKL